MPTLNIDLNKDGCINISDIRIAVTQYRSGSIDKMSKYAMVTSIIRNWGKGCR